MSIYLHSLSHVQEPMPWKAPPWSAPKSSAFRGVGGNVSLLAVMILTVVNFLVLGFLGYLF